MYIAFFLGLSILALIQLDKRLELTHPVVILLSLSILAVLAGLRTSDVGDDYSQYEKFFHSFDGVFGGGIEQVLSGEYYFEPGFALIITIVSEFTNNHVFFFIVIAFLTSFLMLAAVNRLSLYPLCSILIFFSYDYFTSYMVAIRFGLAAAIGLLVLYFIAENKRKVSIVYIFLALSVHMASVGLFIPWLLSFVKFKRSYILIMLLVSLVVGYFGMGGYFVNFFVPSWLPRYESSVIYSEHSSYGRSLGYLGLINLKYLFLTSVLYLYWERLRDDVPYFYTISMFLVIAAAIRIGFHDLGFVVGRVSALLALSEIIMIPAVFISLMKTKSQAYILIVFYAFMHLVMFLFIRGFSDYSSVLNQYL